MLAVALVLFVAQSALCAPAVLVTQQNVNSIAPPVDNGLLVNSGIIDGAIELVDGGEQNVYVLNALQAVNSLADSGDTVGKIIAVGQALNGLDAEAVGNSGDACAYANLANAYVNYVRSGNSGPLRSALGDYANRLIANVRNIVRLAVDPVAASYAYGPTGQCANAGRTYQFEAAWDAIISGTSAVDIRAINDQYCNANRLYNGLHVRNNNIGAGITAAAIPQAVLLLRNAIVPATSFLRVIAAGQNPTQAGNQLIQAISQSASSVQV